MHAACRRSWTKRVQLCTVGPCQLIPAGTFRHPRKLAQARRAYMLSKMGMVIMCELTRSTFVTRSTLPAPTLWASLPAPV